MLQCPSFLCARSSFGGNFIGEHAEAPIYAIKSDTGGVLTHFWCTGGTDMDDNIVTYWVDGSPDVQFQVRMASGVGWVDDVTEAPAAGFHPEANGPWGTQFIGKGSGMGGWYNEWRAPFKKSLTVTVRPPKRLLNLTKADKELLGIASCGSSTSLETSPNSTSCSRFPKMDCWGADMPNGTAKRPSEY